MSGAERTRCRRCASKLAAATANVREAFCSRGCHRIYYGEYCMVCETPMQRTSATQRLCGRRKCRNEFSALRAHFLLGRYMTPDSVSLASGTPIFIGSKRGAKPDRTWHIVAGPAMSDRDLHLATIGAAGIDRKINDRLKNGRGIIRSHHAPLNVIGGYKFENAPEIDGIGAKRPADAVAETPFPAFAEDSQAA
jgi:hypothetical protein